MTSNNVLYRLVGQVGNEAINIAILVVILLVAVIYYYKLKKLMIALIIFFFFASVFFFNSDAKIIYSKDKFFVLSDGSYIQLESLKKDEYEYTRYSKEEKILEMGIYNLYEFSPYSKYRKSNYNLFLDAIIIFIILIIVYLLVFFNEDLIWFRDYKRNIELTPFSYLESKAQKKILKENLFCNSCNSTKEMTLVKEVYTKGMHLLYLNCKACSNETKQRIDL